MQVSNLLRTVYCIQGSVLLKNHYCCQKMRFIVSITNKAEILPLLPLRGHPFSLQHWETDNIISHAHEGIPLVTRRERQIYLFSGTASRWQHNWDVFIFAWCAWCCWKSVPSPHTIYHMVHNNQWQWLSEQGMWLILSNLRDVWQVHSDCWMVMREKGILVRAIRPWHARALIHQSKSLLDFSILINILQKYVEE